MAPLPPSSSASSATRPEPGLVQPRPRPRPRRPSRAASRPPVLAAVALAAACLLPGGCGDGEDRGGSPGADSAVPDPATTPAPAADSDSADPAAAAASDAAAAEIERTTAMFREAQLRQPIGLARVGDLGLSPDLVARAADRRLRAAHHARFHAVFADREIPAGELDEPPPPPERAVSFTLEPHFVPDALMTRRERARTAIPANRGFRPARTVGGPGDQVPSDEAAATGPASTPDLGASGEWIGAAELVARRLAIDGLAATTVRALALSAADLPPGPRRVAAAAEGLAGIGVPVDLLGFLAPVPGPAPEGHVGDVQADDDAERRADARRWIAEVLDRLDAGADPERLAAEEAERPLVIRPTIPGFRASRDDGVDPIGLVRLQPTRGRYWAGRGGGGSLDLTVSLLEALPDAAFVVSVGTPFAEAAMRRMSPGRQGAGGAVTVVDEPHVITQWAQDNGQPGFVAGEDGPWLLAPRYASRGDFGSTFVPGDTWMVEGLPPAGIGVARSPLLFQGGNLLVVGDPSGTGRLLLVGDADIERNVALGLDRPTIIEGFRREFDVDRVVVLRPPAFHLDFAATIRRVAAGPDGPARSVAFVHDEARAHDMVLRIGIDRLVAAGILDGRTASSIREALDADDGLAVVEALGPVLYARQRADGQWPLTLADAFGAAEGGEGIAVLDRFLCSFERLMGLSVDLSRVAGPPEVRAYLATWGRRDADLRGFEEQLASLGFHLVPVPGFSLQTRSVNTVNMTHGRDRILRPVTGGTLAPIDAAAGAAIAAAAGPGVRIIDLPTADTQRRSGAVGCAVAAWPRPPGETAGPALP